MADVTESLVDEREELMVYDETQDSREAHFLKPTFLSNSKPDNHLLPHPLLVLPLKPTFDQLTNFRLECSKGYPSKEWKTWVDMMKPKYQEIWKKAGIYEAILASTYKIHRDKKLVVGLAERWCDKTNTFIFSWGEVTITLEDIMVLGNFSVLGVPHSAPLPEELVDIFNGIKRIHHDSRSENGACAKKWRMYFMGSGKPLEHEAFLAFWLAKFVLVRSTDYISIEHLRVAIHLSHGTKIALAPAVLASIYRDMRKLTESVVGFSRLKTTGKVIIKSINHIDLLHMWAWERFQEPMPSPNAIERGEPRSARWNRVNKVKVKDVRAALDSAKKSFLWRPYTLFLGKYMFPKLYADEQQSVVVDSDETESLVRCLRVSELIDTGYIEQYNPNRVAMQFGLDQDIPFGVIRSNDPETAWCNYNRPMRDVKLYIPHRLFESDVSAQYSGWWEGLMPVDNEDAPRPPLLPCSSARDTVPLATPGIDEDAPTPPLIPCSHERDSIPLVTPGCASKRPREIDEEDDLTIAQLLSRPRKTGSYRNRNDTDHEPQDDVAEDRLTIAQLLSRPRKTGSYRNGKDTDHEQQDDVAEDSLTITLLLDSSRKSGSNVGMTEPVEPAENAVLGQRNHPEVIIIDSDEEESGQDYI